jgi:hypothetical protein
MSPQFRYFVASPFGAILKHQVHANPVSKVFGNPIQNRFRATLKMSGQDQDADDEFSIFFGVQVVSGASRPVFGSV